MTGGHHHRQPRALQERLLVEYQLLLASFRRTSALTPDTGRVRSGRPTLHECMEATAAALALLAIYVGLILRAAALCLLLVDPLSRTGRPGRGP